MATTVTASRSEWQPNSLLPPAPSNSNGSRLEDLIPKPELFAQTSTPSDARPVPPFDNSSFSDARTRAGKVKTRIQLDLAAGIFTSSTDVTGRFSLTCTNSRSVKIGRISVHLAGFEHILNGSSIARSNKRLFYHQSIDLQSTQMAPSEAIVPGPCDEDGMWATRQGSTTFDFSIPLTGSLEGTQLPSSFWNSKAGGIRYVISATVQVKFGFHKPKLLVIHKEAQVVESVSRFLSPNIVPSIHLWAEDSRRVGWLKSRIGDISVKARCHVREFEEEGNSCVLSGVWIAGGVGHVFIEINNESKRKVKTLKAELIRRLKTFSRANSEWSALIPLHFSKAVVAEKTFIAIKTNTNSGVAINCPSPQWAEQVEKKNSLFLKQNWSGVKGGEALSFMTEIDIPPHIRTIQHSLLLEVSYAIQVSIIPKGSPEIKVEIPITILHPLSVLEATPTVSRLSRYKMTQKGHVPAAASIPAVKTNDAKAEIILDVSSETVNNSLTTNKDGTVKSTKSILEPKEPFVIRATATPSPPTSQQRSSDFPTSLDELDALSALLIKQTIHTISPPCRAPPTPPQPEFSAPPLSHSSSSSVSSSSAFKKSQPIFGKPLHILAQQSLRRDSTVAQVYKQQPNNEQTITTSPLSTAGDSTAAVLLKYENKAQPSQISVTTTVKDEKAENSIISGVDTALDEWIVSKQEQEGSELARAIGAEILSRRLKSKMEIVTQTKESAATLATGEEDVEEKAGNQEHEEKGVYQDGIKQGISAQIEEIFAGLESV
ncbi:UNVERIFIED_CONTAM: hypothetical protein HDU68_000279 [Siphonaria sp. JEL0065]|nr:hypothetical protein HDU68_000279 [Siphonaria sp. JEL0065]